MDTTDLNDPAQSADRPQGKGPEAGKAAHGPRNEVSWDGGRGRQPYENQDPQTPADPGAAEFPEGNRGEASGKNLEELEKVREKWRDSP